MTIFATHDFPLSSSFGPLAHSGRNLMIALYISTQMRRLMQTIIALHSIASSRLFDDRFAEPHARVTAAQLW